MSLCHKIIYLARLSFLRGCSDMCHMCSGAHELLVYLLVNTKDPVIEILVVNAFRNNITAKEIVPVVPSVGIIIYSLIKTPLIY